MQHYNFHYSFYSDLLLSLRYFFNNIIFQTDLIRSFEFNTGNRTLQLDYKSQHELPAALINYQIAKPIAYHPYVFQGNSDNINQVPVLYNRTKDLLLELQETLYEISVDITINCESQLQALEIEQMLQHFSPVGKYLQHYRFYSFMKINNEFIHPDIFDINNDLIYNLFTKYNRKTDSVDYCFAVQYQPLLKFESITAQMSSSDARSFAVSCPLVIMSPVPIKQFIPADQKPLVGKPIRVYDRFDIIGATAEVNVLLLSFCDQTIICSVLPDAVTGEFTSKFVRMGQSYNITGIIEEEKIEIDSSQVVVGNKKYNCTFNISRDLLTGIDTIIVSGSFAGALNNASFDDESIKGFLVAAGEYVDIDVDDLTVIRRSKILKSFTVQENLTQNVKVLPIGNIYNTNLDLAVPQSMQLQTKNSVITKVAVLKDNIQIITTLDTPIPISTIGAFNGTFSVDGEIVQVVLFGNLNIKSGNFDYDVTFSIDGFKLVALFFDLQFKTGQYYGSRTIKRISTSTHIDFANEVISTFPEMSVSKDLFDNETMGLTLQSNGKLLRSTIIVPEDVVKVESNKVLITVNLDELFDYSDYPSNFWRFIFKNQIFSSQDASEIQFLEATERFILTFSADQSFFYEHFDGHAVDNPIFFQFFKS